MKSPAEGSLCHSLISRICNPTYDTTVASCDSSWAGCQSVQVSLRINTFPPDAFSLIPRHTPPSLNTKTRIKPNRNVSLSCKVIQFLLPPAAAGCPFVWHFDNKCRFRAGNSLQDPPSSRDCHIRNHKWYSGKLTIKNLSKEWSKQRACV